jgi:antitoxin component YwqK of YwqJK toxin-antitoxin module
MKRICAVVLIVLSVLFVNAQDTILSNGHNVFHYPNGKVSSEGFMVNGQPDGYWKTFYEDGTLKSEGNRKNFLLDSAWRFYDDSGKIVVEINYAKMDCAKLFKRMKP